MIPFMRRTSTVIPIPVPVSEINNTSETPPPFFHDETIDLTTHLAMLRNTRSPTIELQKSESSMKRLVQDVSSSSGARSTTSGATTAQSVDDNDIDIDNIDDGDIFDSDFAIGFVRLDDPLPSQRESTVSLCLSSQSVDEECGPIGTLGINTRSEADLIFGDIEL